MKSNYAFVSLLLFFILITGCLDKEIKNVELPNDTDARSLVPDIENYNVDKDILGKGAPVISGIITNSLASAAPVIAPFRVPIAFAMTNFITCAEEKNVAVIAYYNTPSDLADHGILVIGEENIDKLYKCLGNLIPFSVVLPAKSYGLYAASYQIRNTNTNLKYYIGFIATTDIIADSICSELPECDETKMFRLPVFQN
ncbi:MAG: hypothetical protein Q7S92_05865 [Candidatus Diapherotrites archaeon]|nr:hypothetical protein [Candidatus Diapherotrites archaeon]